MTKEAKYTKTTVTLQMPSPKSMESMSFLIRRDREDKKRLKWCFQRLRSTSEVKCSLGGTKRRPLASEDRT
jgi:hypothetical protein